MTRHGFERKFFCNGFDVICLDGARAWTSEEQKKLEQAGAVDGRTKKECMLRYKVRYNGWYSLLGIGARCIAP